MSTTAHTCEHLAPIEQALAEQGVPLGEGRTSPYGEDWGLWSECNAVFDAPALRARLALPDFITYEEYDGRVAGSDATFYCPRCKRAIMGIHPNYARANTPRVS
ncbi:MAG: hypothetical protein U0Q16_08615 [Bryobacteraceae bacterium]